ncbi:hypothetical protein [Stratiformator vulcanicus]|nr:hypothetical protein [Stratiformator vulcanicus]
MERTRSCVVTDLNYRCLIAAAILLADPIRHCEAQSAEEIPAAVKPWLAPQVWKRDVEKAVLTLGEAGHFDDRHIFAPSVIRKDGRFLLYYSGSRGDVNERVFRLGLATSRDGRDFNRHPQSPIFGFADNRRSVVTPSLLRSSDGTAVRDQGRLRMWFSARDLTDPESPYEIHETSSSDGIRWSKPSKPLLSEARAPSVLKTDNGYRMRYVDVSREPWAVRHAQSDDGLNWSTSASEVLKVDQEWERLRINYPFVMQVETTPGGEPSSAVYLMWYGSRTKPGPRTAIGFAASTDGITWHKHPNNPVLRPDPERPWESHYTTSQSVMRLNDGSFRMWYASRKKPPHVNKYFAINTAVWK